MCPRRCRLHDGQRAFCFVRKRQGDEVVLTTYGLSTGFCIDPIEKKPLNHFLPGTPVLSFGTAGCNLGCKFCQNWDISKSREVARLSQPASPDAIAATAIAYRCRSVAYTYNDPVVWAEYVVDTAQACHAHGLRNVLVSAGYISAEARPEFFRHIDAANIDLKSFQEGFYRQVCLAEMSPVLDTLKWIRRQTDIWLEITTLIIPGHNDSHDELKRLSHWIARELGPHTPLHLSAFHPDYRMRETPRTPLSTLQNARGLALSEGLQFVYTGNVHHQQGDTTWCSGCGTALIIRDWYELKAWNLDHHRCLRCGTTLAGAFEKSPGRWGSRRLPVTIQH